MVAFSYSRPVFDGRSKKNKMLMIVRLVYILHKKKDVVHNRGVDGLLPKLVDTGYCQGDCSDADDPTTLLSHISHSSL